MSLNLKFSRRKLFIAFMVAAAADVLSIFFSFTPPLEWILDMVTAILLFFILGWQWALLPGLIMEAIPGISVFPFWVIVVASIAIWGKSRLKLF